MSRIIAVALKELLKAGEHKGPCTNLGIEDEAPCDKHIEAYNRRVVKAKMVLDDFEKKKRA